jgi:hypothetical protein
MLNPAFADAEQLLAAGATNEGVDALMNLWRATPEDSTLRAQVMLRVGDVRRDTQAQALATSMWSSAALCVLTYEIEGELCNEIASRLRPALGLDAAVSSREVLAWAALRHAKELLADMELEQRVDAFTLAVQVAFSRMVPDGQPSSDVAERLLHDAGLHCASHDHAALGAKLLTRAAELAHLRGAPTERQRALLADARDLCWATDNRGDAAILDGALQRLGS